MKRSESQSLYSALPGACITYTSDSKESKERRYTDKKSLRITYWKSKKIDREDIYYPKIVSQILPDLYDFKSENNEKIKLEGLLANLLNKEYRDRVNFLEINPYNEGIQILGHIFPKMFYCPKCGKIKFLQNDKDISNMFCDCTGTMKAMNQYNRIWVCSCGNIYSIDEKQVDTSKLRYFASVKDGFVKSNGGLYRIPNKICQCGNICTLENATDPKAFYPRIITSIKLTENEEASLCKSEEGRKLIIDRQIGKIGEEEFKRKAKEILKKNTPYTELDIGLDDNFDFLNDLACIEKEKLSEDKVEEETLYRMLEYNTIKRKIVTDMDTSIKNSKKFGKILDESEIYDMLKKLQIENISSVSDIEIINTAYGYTRKYQAPDEMRTDRKEPLVLRAFHDVNNFTIPNFYNIRTKTEGIIIDIDKRALYNYLKTTYSTTKQFVFKNLNDEELNRWFLDKTNLDTRLIKKFEEIDTQNGNMTNLYTKCIYEVLHTISHMFINTISKFCGIDKSSLSEMIFLNAGAILIYSKTNQGAVLGALTQTFDKYLYEMLKCVYRDNEICTFDPLCMNTSDGSCCACTYLDEVACEHFNKDLSRRLLYGYKEKGIDEIIINFWEEI